ncbi:MAG: hypothetical protein V1672_03530 [Candidatus Diapherotrites archaeon]
MIFIIISQGAFLGCYWHDLCPEAVLVRKAELCYANIATVSDYDNLGEHLSIKDILKGALI